MDVYSALWVKAPADCRSFFGKCFVGKEGEGMLESHLFINKIFLAKEIPCGNYLKELPVVKNLNKIDILLLY